MRQVLGLRLLVRRTTVTKVTKGFFDDMGIIGLRMSEVKYPPKFPAYLLDSGVVLRGLYAAVDTAIFVRVKL